jgi:hypothetical protein
VFFDGGLLDILGDASISRERLASARHRGGEHPSMFPQLTPEGTGTD